MGIDIKKILKKTAEVGVKVAKVGDVLDVPVLDQINTAMEIIQKSSAEDHDKKAAQVLLESAKSTPVIIGATDDSGVGALQSKRFKMVVVGIAALIATHLGYLPKEMADEITPYVMTLILGYLGVETFRPSAKPQQ